MIGVRQGRVNFSVGDAVSKDRDPAAATLFENSAAANTIGEVVMLGIFLLPSSVQIC